MLTRVGALPGTNDYVATILVVDDNDADRELLTHLLRRRGYRVLEVEDARSAIETVHAGGIDLILLDVNMPDSSGMDLCRELNSHSETRLIPVVLVTGAASAQRRIEGLESGAMDLLMKPVRPAELYARTRALLQLKHFTDELEHAETVLCSLALSIEAKDPHTEGHCDRLSRLSADFARHLGLPEEQRVALRRAGIVHDIGKVAVPESILLKPGPLTAAERQVMEKHPVVGERICAPLKSFRLVLPLIRHHHERMNGTGYPDGLRSTQIPLSVRILQTADIYDALTSKRPYRDALAPRMALAVMKEEARRGWWDETLVSEFESVLPQPLARTSSMAAPGPVVNSPIGHH